ncbi:MAG: hypothetical protein ACRDT4_14235 [Micromonosporaceae bacterium]
MQSTLTRVSLLVLALAGLLTGGWAVASPRGFYDDFPGFGRHWVSADGPYNEHLVRDVGAFFLALGLVAGFAVWLGSIAAARLAGLGWLVFSVPHALYHFTHLGVYDTLDQLLNVVSLGLGLVLATQILLWPGRASDPADRSL